MNDRELGALFAAAIQLIIKRVSLDDSERVSIAEFHEAWQPKAYGASEYVRHGETDAGRAQLWMSTRSVAASAPAPDMPASPQNWRRL
ncbi:MAG: hypothetical protein LBI48_00710 [Burkholderiaceae bacterium]|jgi:hypothetical protein|nr:hypothetical protein [Burkholderiaceae bacterium]